MKYVLLFIVWLILCILRLIWEFQIVDFKNFFEEEKEGEEFDPIY